MFAELGHVTLDLLPQFLWALDLLPDKLAQESAEQKSIVASSSVISLIYELRDTLCSRRYLAKDAKRSINLNFDLERAGGGELANLSILARQSYQGATSNQHRYVSTDVVSVTTAARPRQKTSQGRGTSASRLGGHEQLGVIEDHQRICVFRVALRNIVKRLAERQGSVTGDMGRDGICRQRPPHPAAAPPPPVGR